MESIAARVAHLRRLSGLSQRAFAERCHLSPAHVRLIESGLRPDPATSTLAAVALTAGVSLDWIARGLGETPAHIDLSAPAATGTEG